MCISLLFSYHQSPDLCSWIFADLFSSWRGLPTCLQLQYCGWSGHYWFQLQCWQHILWGSNCSRITPSIWLFKFCWLLLHSLFVLLGDFVDGSVMLRTNDYFVGPHNLSIVATDQSGNTAESTLTFTTPKLCMYNTVACNLFIEFYSTLVLSQHFSFIAPCSSQMYLRTSWRLAFCQLLCCMHTGTVCLQLWCGVRSYRLWVTYLSVDMCTCYLVSLLLPLCLTRWQWKLCPRYKCLFSGTT